MRTLNAIKYSAIERNEVLIHATTWIWGVIAKWVLITSLSEEEVLKLERGGGLCNIMNTLKDSELYTLKLKLIVCYMNFTSVKAINVFF